MSKITFRADDDLVAQLEGFDASKSEVMREALRAYLDESEARAGGADPSQTDPEPTPAEESLDDLVADRVDDIVAERVDAVLADRLGTIGRSEPQDVNVTVSLEDAVATIDRTSEGEQTSDQSTVPDSHETSGERTCAKCGETVSAEHVYCPNCGEKASHRVFCECGDELRSDWAFCPSCGRRTAAADVLDQ